MADQCDMVSQHSNHSQHTSEDENLFGDENEVAALDVAMPTPHMRPINSNSPFSPRKDDSQSIASGSASQKIEESRALLPPAPAMLDVQVTADATADDGPKALSVLEDDNSRFTATFGDD